jgi:hypothetical protein
MPNPIAEQYATPAHIMQAIEQARRLNEHLAFSLILGERMARPMLGWAYINRPTPIRDAFCRLLKYLGG